MIAVALVGQRVQERVSGGVVGLPGSPQDACHRREHNKRIEIGVGGELVQMPSGVGFGG
ncbi:hypothetical protein NCTC2275_00126 [Mycobacterium marinum]|nr:hypothetical protein NCTC2275_00126 [Mycobacterium marinum]